MKKFVCLILALLMLSVFCACSSEETESSSETSSVISEVSSEPEISSEIVEEVETEPESLLTNPLTGEAVDEDISMNRPYAIMINNNVAALPHHGVSQADILFEVPVEGGITRMLAVFQDVSDVDVIGSIRSARHDFLDLSRWLDAIYIHAGGSPYAYDDLSNFGIDHVDGVKGDGSMFYRDEYRRYNLGYEHSLMTTGSDILSFVPKYGFQMKHDEDYDVGFTFVEKPVLEGAEKAESFTVNVTDYKSTSFEYDAASEQYLASQFGGAYIDGNNDEQLGFSNVVALFTDMHVMDNYGRMEIDINSEGTGYYFCGGEVASINWSKSDAESPYVLTYESGEQVVLKTGTSYFGIVDSNMYVDFE